ncbi:MAG: sulfatase-like hydrolase/transferase [Promethearchaeota archaeon]
MIMTDEHDPGVSGCYGNGIVNTPNIDNIARDGVIFDACYTTSPLCVPARLSFTAGKYVSRVFAWNNTTKLPSDGMPTLPRALRNAGYDTILCGKMHYDRNRRYGFEHDIIPEFNGKKKVTYGARREPGDTSLNVRNWEKRSKSFHPGNDSRILRHDRRVTAESIKVINGRSSNDPPMFLLVGYLAPHFPLTVPVEYFRKYKDKIPMPEIPDGLIGNLPLNYKHLRYGFGVEGVEPGLVKRGRELYYALVEWMDAEVGKVIAALDGSPIAGNTMVIFTSDHGENKGDHGLWWKNNMYDHAAKIPLLMRWPGEIKAGERRPGACSLVDVVKTIADVGGVKTPEDWDGDSLLEYIRDKSSTWKDFALSEYYGHNIASGITMVRRGDWKYVYHNKIGGKTGGERELFNLRDDPGELNNLAGNDKYAENLLELHALIVKELGEEPDNIEKRFIALANTVRSRITRFGLKNYAKFTRIFKQKQAMKDK